MRIYIGWDYRDALAYQVAVESILEVTTGPIDIRPIYGAMLRPDPYRRSYRVGGDGQMRDDIDGKPFSTDFSFARFAIPILEDYSPEPVIYLDPDILVLRDLREMLEESDPSCGVSCVQHCHEPPEGKKMDGVLQTNYYRKNWSSVMVIRSDMCQAMTRAALNIWLGADLHALHWANKIGKLSPSWNWLEGWDSEDADADIIHYTRGTPDMVPADKRPMRCEDEWATFANYVDFPTLHCVAV